MAIRIAVGDESFDEIRKAGLYYVDKTELIRITNKVLGTMQKFVCISRPRRFGSRRSRR